MDFNTRWDVLETKRQLYNRSAWNTIDAMMYVGLSGERKVNNDYTIRGRD